MMHMKAIVNADNNWAIGKNGNLINKFPEDFNFFKEKTKNSIIICGRNTFNEMGPLKNRITFVLTSDKNNLKDDVLKKADYYNVFGHDKSSFINFIPDISQYKNPVFIVDDFYSAVVYSEYLKNHYKTINNVYICGGSFLYKEACDYCDEVFITKCNNTIEGADRFFPIQKFKRKFLYIKGDPKVSTTGISYSFDTLKKGRIIYYDR